MLTALHLARRVGAADALAEWRDKEILPGPGALDVEQHKDFLRRSTGTYFHASGTGAMGSGAAAVVDSELRVRGLDGLRIADVSVMPTLVGANTNAVAPHAKIANFDVVCTGRFYDFFEQRDGGWAIVRRQPIYEKDRLDMVDPAARTELDPALLDRFPVGYRHLAYLQTHAWFDVKPGLPGLTGPAVDTLYTEGRAWLAGKPLETRSI
jgi:hypothetical protein